MHIYLPGDQFLVPFQRVCYLPFAIYSSCNFSQYLGYIWDTCKIRLGSLNTFCLTYRAFCCPCAIKLEINLSDILPTDRSHPPVWLCHRCCDAREFLTFCKRINLSGGLSVQSPRRHKPSHTLQPAHCAWKLWRRQSIRRTLSEISLFTRRPHRAWMCMISRKEWQGGLKVYDSYLNFILPPTTRPNAVAFSFLFFF